MEQPSTGDRVRIDIPDETDPDHDAYHGREGTIINRIRDDADTLSGDERDAVLYRIELEGGDQVDFRWHDLRPAFSE